MAKVFDEIIARILADDKMEDRPHAWIQWKGTDVCMDVRCPCGRMSHVDGQFAYYFECRCGLVWAVGQNVRLHRLTDAEGRAVVADGGCLVRDSTQCED